MGRPLYSTRYATSSASTQSASSSNSAHCEKWTHGAAFDPDSDEYYERHAILEAFVDHTPSRGSSAGSFSTREAVSSSSSSGRRPSAPATETARGTASATRRTPQHGQDRPHVVTASPSSNSQYPIIPSPTSPSAARRGSFRPDMWRTFTEMEQMWQEAISRHDTPHRPSGSEEHHMESHSTPASGATPIDIPTRTPARHHTHREQTLHRDIHGSGWSHSPIPLGTSSPSSVTPGMSSWSVNSTHNGRHAVPVSPSPRDSSVSTRILHPTHMATSLVRV